MPTPAKAQWARASLKNAMRLLTTSDPTAPATRLTSTIAIRARTMNGDSASSRAALLGEPTDTALQPIGDGFDQIGHAVIL